MAGMNLSRSLRTGTSQALRLTPAVPRATRVIAHGAGNDRTYSFASFFETERAVSDVAEAIVLARSRAGLGLGADGGFSVETTLGIPEPAR